MAWLFQPLLIVDTGAAAYSLTANSGAVALAGQDATLTYEPSATHYTLTADVGSFALTGVAATLTKSTVVTHYTLTAATGVLALTGIAAITRYAHNLIAANGTFTLTGVAAGMQCARKLVAALHTFALTGIAANLVVAVARRLLVEAGAVLLTGSNVSLVYAAKVHYAIEGLPGNFVLLGQPAILSVMRMPTPPEFLQFGRPVFHIAGRW